MKKTEKLIFVDNLKEELKAATAVVLVDYKGLTVKMQQELKKRLKTIDAKMFVAKNTLYKIAAKEAKLPEESYSDTVLSGPTAFILTEKDAIAPLQIIAKFSKEFEIPQFKVGIVDKTFEGKENLIKLANLPAKDVLYSQVVGAVSAPLYNLVGTLQGNLQKLVYILNAKIKS